jgi:hypothetical protein
MAKLIGVDLAALPAAGSGSGDTAFSVKTADLSGSLFRISGDGVATISGSFTVTGSALISDNVGIGKTTPNAKLDVNGNAIVSGSLTVTNGSSVVNLANGSILGKVGTTNYIIVTGSSSTGGVVQIAHTNTTVVGQLTGNSGGAGNGLDLGFYNNLNLKTLNSSITITANAAPSWRVYSGMNFTFQGYSGYGDPNGGEVIMKDALTGNEAFHAYLGANQRIIMSSSSLAINQTTPGAKLDIRTAGNLSTDLGLRIRNFANTSDILKIAGNGNLSYNAQGGGITLENYDGTTQIGSVGGSATRVNLIAGANVSMYLNVAGTVGAIFNSGRGGASGETAFKFNAKVGGNAGTINYGKIINLLDQSSGNRANTVVGLSIQKDATNTNTLLQFQAIEAPKGRVSIGWASGTYSGAKFDVLADGALSTDIALRVRNSANTGDMLNVKGNGNVQIGVGGISICRSDSPNGSLLGTITYRTDGTFGFTLPLTTTKIVSPTSTLSFTQLDGFQHIQQVTGNWADAPNAFVFQSTGAQGLNSISNNFFTVINGTDNMFAIKANGNIGIGKTSPNAKLDISGSVLISGSLGIGGNTRISSPFNTAVSGSTLSVYGSGSSQPVFTVQGSQGELFSVTDSLSGSLFSVNDISGLPIMEVFSDNTTLMGSYQDPMLITTTKVTQTNSGSFTVYSLPTASYDTAFFEYSIRSGSNARAGTIMAMQLGSTVNFTETTTTDFGSTSAVSFTVIVTGSNMALTGSSTSGAWTIKTIVRGI